MSHNPEECDIYQIVTGRLMEPDNQRELDAVVKVDNACDGACDDAEHRFEIVNSEGHTFEVLVRPKTKMD